MDEQVGNKKLQVKEAMREIQNITRQKELLNNELADYFQLLKNLGFPRKIVSIVLKERQKTRFQVESEKILTDELEQMLGE